MTLEPGPADKRMRLRYAGACRLCAAPLPAGIDAIYERGSKTVRCVTCTATPVQPDNGVAGASARREHERRKNAREQLFEVHDRGEYTQTEIAELFSVSRATVYRELQHRREKFLASCEAHIF